MFTVKHRIIIGLCLLAIVGVLYARPYMIGPAPAPSETEKPPTKDGVKGAYTNLDSLEDPKTLHILAYEWPPFSYKDKQNLYTGADTEIIRAVLERMGYAPQFVDMPFKRILDEMRNGSYPAMLPCVVDGDRRNYLFFSKPVSSIFSVLWKPKNMDFTWDSYDDLVGLRIGASYYEYGAGFFKAAREGNFILDMVSHEAPEQIHFRKLVEGKIDMFICEQSVGLFLRHAYAAEFDTVDYCSKGVGPRRPFSFALSKSYFKDRESEARSFLNRFNRELEVFASEGKRTAIFKKYLMEIPVDDKHRLILPKRGTTKP